MIAVGITLFSHFMQVLGGSFRLPVIIAAWAPAILVTVLGPYCWHGWTKPDFWNMKAAMKILGQFLITTAALEHAVFAQIRIATINQQPVTNYDVEQRALFLEFATNIEITDQNRERIFEDALQLIIDDKLRLAEVETLFPDVEALVMPQVRDFMNRILAAPGNPDPQCYEMPA